MTSIARSWGPRAGRLLLTVTAVVGAVCAVLAVLAVVTGVRPIVFRSGSMEPAVSTGALGFSRNADAADLKVGDVVTVKNAQGKTITHRVVAIGPNGRSASLRLKGDDNPVPDQEIYQVTHVPRLWFSIPDAGYVVAWFANAPGSYLLGGYIVLMLMLAFRRREDADGGTTADEVAADPTPGVPSASEASQPRPNRGPFAVVTAGALFALVMAVVAGWSQSTWAAWNNAVAVTGTSIKTATTFNGPTLTCTKGNSIVTMNWTAWPGATGYILHFGAGGASTTTVSSATLSRVFNVVGQSGTFTVEATTATVNSPLSNAKNYVIGNGVGNTDCTNP